MKIQQMSIFVIVLFIGTLLAGAQSRMKERGGRDDAQVKRINEKVGLTDDQAVNIKAILKKAREEARADVENGTGNRDAMRTKMMKRAKETDAEILKLLTKEQKVKYEAYRKERQKEIQERMRERQ